MSELASARRSKAAFKGGITKSIKDLDDFIKVASEDDIVAKKVTVNKALHHIANLNERIADLLTEGEELHDEVISDMQYEEVVQKALVKLDKVLKSKGTPTNQKSFIKLPEISLPRFSGDPALWTGFWDLFQCSVHGRTDLSEVQKLTYLKGQLEGEALQLISGFGLEANSYAPAVTLLQETYGQIERVKAAYITSFCNIKTPKYEVTELKGFHAAIECALKSIQTAHVSLDEFCTVMLYNKLPSPMREIIKRELGDQWLDLASVTKAFHKEICNMEGMGAEYRSINPATAAFTIQSNKGCSRGKQTSNNSDKGCKLCNKPGHFWFKCFKYPNAPSKIRRAKVLKVCTGCLGKCSGAECTHPKVEKCRNCGGKHFHSLCPDKWEEKDNAGQPVNVLSLTTGKNLALLPTLQIPVQGRRQTTYIRALLDQCAQKSFIQRACLSQINYHVVGQERLELQGFIGQQGEKSYDVVSIKYRYKTQWRRLDAVVVDSLPSYRHHKELTTVTKRLETRNIRLADKDLNSDGTVDVLIGADNYYKFVQPGFKHVDNIVLVPTIYGYSLSGSFRTHEATTSVEVVTVLRVATGPVCHYVRDDELPRQIEDLGALWELDHVGIAPGEEEESKLMSQFTNSIQYDETTQQYTVQLPWRMNKHRLPSNYGLALGRLRGLQSKFVRSPEYCEKYSKVIEEQLSKGYIEKVSRGSTGSPVHYLAHHGVQKESKTTPVRVVFDASARAGPDSLSLNDCLHTGPSLVADLTQVLLRFRLGGQAWVSDIEKAYLMLKLHHDDVDSTRFLWPDDPLDINSPVSIYRFRVVLFGATCSQFLLNATISKHLSNIREGTELVQRLKDGLYIDNLQGTSDDEQDLITLYHDSKQIFSGAHLFLREWVTNSPNLRALMTQNGDASEIQSSVKTLGMVWKTEPDMLAFQKREHLSEASTKRQALSITAKIFDPLGVLLPVTIQARLFVQELWKTKCDWDETLHKGLRERWERIGKELESCMEIKIPRRVAFTRSVDLHVFGDASSVAYGAAAYFCDSSGQSRLIMAKGKVAPIKKLTIPKLEITAVLLASRLAKFIKEAYSSTLTIHNLYIWSDSKISLCWLASNKRLPVYVENRVKEILVKTPDAKYRYVQTKDNPGDLLTRGVAYTDLVASKLWWEGPSWLPHSENWPDQENKGHVSQLVVAAMHDATPNETCAINWQRCHSFGVTIRVMAWVTRYLSNLKAKSKGLDLTKGPLTVAELRTAERKIIIQVQGEVYKQEQQELSTSIKPTSNIIKQLGLYMEEGIIRCRGRLQRALLDDCAKFPILLPPKHRVTSLLIEDSHRLCLHYGVGYLVAYLRQRWWIPRMRQTVKAVTGKCVICRRMQGKSYALQPAPPLPEFRVRKAEPFQVTGVDYTGSLNVRGKEGNVEKVYIVLFTCAVTRAIHLEVASDLSCETFMHAFRRFSSRKGYPQLMLSDNATTFISSANILKNKLNNPQLQQQLSQYKCEWRFIPVRAPWFGAIWERSIGTVKAGLKKVLGRASVTLTELLTILTELEATVNDRPIGYVSGDLNDPIPITPSQLVTGRRLRPYPEPITDDELTDPSMYNRDNISSRYAYICKLSNDLWKRWTTDYLLSLRETHRVRTRRSGNLWPTVGDVVLVHDEGPRLFWRLGLILKLLPGLDGITRVAQIKTSTGVTTRPIVKLYPLEQECDTIGEVSDDSDNPEDTKAQLAPESDSNLRATRRAALGSKQLWQSLIRGGDL